MENLFSIVLIGISLVELYLAIYFFRTKSGVLLRIYYALFVSGVFVWVFSVGAYQLLDFFFPYPQYIIAEIANRIAFVGPIILVTALVVISVLFPFPIRRVTKVHHVLFTVVVVAWAVLIIGTDYFIQGTPEDLEWGVAEYGRYYPLFAIYFLSLWLLSVLILAKKWIQSSGIQRWLLSRFLIGVIGSSVIGVLTNLILPYWYNESRLWWMGPMASLIWLGFTTHIIKKQSDTHSQ